MSETKMGEKRLQARLNISSTAGQAAGLERFAKDLRERSGVAFADRDDARAFVLRGVADMAMDRADELRKRQKQQEAELEALVEEPTP